MDPPGSLKDSNTPNNHRKIRGARSDKIFILNKEDELYHCNISSCTKSFQNKSGLSKHLDWHKNENKKNQLKEKRRAKSATTAGGCEMNSSLDCKLDQAERSNPKVSVTVKQAGRTNRIVAKSKVLIYDLVDNFKEDFAYFNETTQPKTISTTKGNKRNKKIQIKIEEKMQSPLNQFCICKGPDDGLHPMIQCDYCEDWFHFECVGIDQVSI